MTNRSSSSVLLSSRNAAAKTPSSCTTPGYGILSTDSTVVTCRPNGILLPYRNGSSTSMHKHRYPAGTLLADELWCQVACYLDVDSLNQMRLVSRKFRALASTDQAGWGPLWQRLQSHKLHIHPRASMEQAVAPPATSPSSARNPHDHPGSVLPTTHADEGQTEPTTLTAPATPARDAYRLACQQAMTHSSEISLDDLCYESSHIVWSFRFKKSAGADWTHYDPWQQGQSARRMVFLRNGQVRQLVRQERQTSDDTIRAARKSGESTATTDDSTSKKVVTRYNLSLPFGDATNQQGSTVSWRTADVCPTSAHPFVSGNKKDNSTKDSSNKNGNRDQVSSSSATSSLCLTVDGRDVPSYVVRRNVRGNWGYIIENCWSVFYSFPIPTKPSVQLWAARVVLGRQHQQPSNSTSATRSTHKRSALAQESRRSSNDDTTAPSSCLFKRRKQNDLINSHHHRGSGSDPTRGSHHSQQYQQWWREAFLYNAGLTLQHNSPRAMQQPMPGQHSASSRSVND